MANTNQNVAANIASFIDGQEVRYIDDRVKVLDLTPTPMVAWVKQGKPVKLRGDDLVYERIVDRRLQRTVTTTEAIVTATTDFTFSTSDAARIQVGHTLISLGDGSVHNAEVVRATVATASGGTTVTFSRGFGGTTATTHADTTVWRVMSPVFADGATFVQSVTSYGEVKTFLPFVLQYQDNLTPIRSASRSYLEHGKDPLEFRLERLRKEKMPELEALLLHSRSSTISASTAGAPAGIRQLISTNTTAISGVLTATHIENMCETLYAWDGPRRLTVVGNGDMQRVWDAVWRQYFDVQGEPVRLGKISFGVKRYDSRSMGEIDFMRCDACMAGELLYLSDNSFELSPLDWMYGSGWHEFERNVKETNALGKAIGMYAAYVLHVNDERLHGKQTGITTTISSYAGGI